MSTIKVYSAGIEGLNAYPVEITAQLSQTSDQSWASFHTLTIVGLPDTAVNESKERVSAAIKNIGATPPHHSKRRVIVNLAPADLKKQGPAYDLPIAVAFLIASSQIKTDDLTDKVFVGELSLEGKVRNINGLLPIALAMRDQGFKTIFVPQAGAAEAALVNGLEVIPIDSLDQLLAHLEKTKPVAACPATDIAQLSNQFDYPVDLAYIKGQEQAKRALEIAASGSHNLLV